MKDQEIRLGALQLSAQLLGANPKIKDILETSDTLLSYINGASVSDIVKENYKITETDLIELKKCIADPIYFIENYVKIQHPTKGDIPFNLHIYQKYMIGTIHTHNDVIINASRQIGKSATIGAYLLWNAIFNTDQTILVISSRFASALEIADRIRFMFDNLPHFLKPGIKAYNKGCLEFANGSRILFRGASGDAGRGLAVSLIYLDEFAYISNKIAYEVWTALQPALSTGGKCIIASSPSIDSGPFYEIFTGQNRFIKMTFPYNVIPDRDDAWEANQRAGLGDDIFEREYNCIFKKS